MQELWYQVDTNRNKKQKSKQPKKTKVLILEYMQVLKNKTLNN